MEAFLVIAVGLMNILCLVTGVRIGQATAKGELVKLPEINPMEAVRERRDKREAEREQDRLSTVLSNIESYDGTGNGQKDVPRG